MLFLPRPFLLNFLMKICFTNFIHLFFVSLNSNYYCYSTGKVQYGELNWQGTKSDQCHRVFNAKQWHHFEVAVQKDKVTLRVDHAKIVKWYAALENAAYGGIVLKNGWGEHDKEQVLYKNLKVE